MWNAGHQRGISQLELELQGEVDKYIATFWLLRAQHPGHQPREVLPALFEKTHVDPRLPPARQQPLCRRHPVTRRGSAPGSRRHCCRTADPRGTRAVSGLTALLPPRLHA